MLIEEYVTDRSQRDRSSDIDLAEELSVIDRVHIDTDDIHDKISVKYRPDEIIADLVDSDWDDAYHTPIETTILVLDEDETIEREDIAAARAEAMDRDDVY